MKKAIPMLIAFVFFAVGLNAQSAAEIQEVQQLIQKYENAGMTAEANLYKQKLNNAKSVSQQKETKQANTSNGVSPFMQMQNNFKNSAGTPVQVSNYSFNYTDAQAEQLSIQEIVSELSTEDKIAVQKVLANVNDEEALKQLLIDFIKRNN